MIKRGIVIFSIILVIITTQGCNNNSTSRLYLKLNLKSGSNTLLYNTNYTVAGYTIQFNMVKFYLSRIEILNNQGNLEFYDLYLLADAEKENTFLISELENGNYTGIRMGFGVDSTRNDINGSNAIPAYDYPDEHPLNASNNMYWSWNPGYIWMKLEGKIDLNANGNFADAGETFSLHTGLNLSYRTLTRNYDFSITGEDKTLQLDADILKFFDGYDIANQLNAHAFSTSSPEYIYVTELVDNAELVFGEVYE